jgi:hypothetical protein
MVEFVDAVPADGRFAADVLTARTPADPRDGFLMSSAWAQSDPGWSHVRKLVTDRGVRAGYVSAWWPDWQAGVERFAGGAAAVLPGREELLDPAIAELEAIARAGGADRIACDCLESDEPLIAAFRARGWEPGRQAFRSEIDLKDGEPHLRELWARTRRRLEEQAVEIGTLAGRDDTFLARLLEVINPAWEDTPRTGPYTPMTLEGLHSWLESPGSSRDSWFVALAGGEPVGLSVIGYPVERGFPHTDTTAVGRRWRGRGIGLGLKLATLMQAIERGYDRARTENDTANAPILHLNREVLGYRLVPGEQELHLRL